jgi:DNA-binding transcriptional regulator YhcF (GntR family)
VKTLRIDLGLPVPAYEQIVRGVRGLLVGGELRPGDVLPTVRQLAGDLGVNHNTVAEAYRMLAREGWLDLRQGRGATVIERSSPKATRAARVEMLRHLEHVIAKAVSDGVPRSVIAEELERAAASTRKGESS